MSIRDTLRNLTIGKKVQFKTEIVVIDEGEFEVRAPSIKQRNAIITAAGLKAGNTKEEVSDKISATELQLLSVIFLTFVPGTDEPVFALTDKESLLEQPVGGFVDILAAAAMRMMNVKSEGEEEAGKN